MQANYNTHTNDISFVVEHALASLTLTAAYIRQRRDGFGATRTTRSCSSYRAGVGAALDAKRNLLVSLSPGKVWRILIHLFDVFGSEKLQFCSHSERGPDNE